MKNFLKTLLSSVASKRMVNTEATPEMLIPVLYHYDTKIIPEDMISSCLHLLGGGLVEADFPFEFFFSRLDSTLLVYTENGGGSMSYGSHHIPVTGNTLLLFHGSTPFSLKSTIHPWKFYIFFFDGNDTRLFSSILSLPAGCSIKTDKLPLIRQYILRLLSIHPQVDMLGLLNMHQSLTDLMVLSASAMLPANHTSPSGHPYYLTQLKATFDYHYEEPFSLETYEQLYQISRYRLCREFSRAFGMPPLQYMTRRRLEEAKEMLLTTDLTVQEISSRIGYDNVNHFIQLFKKNIGTTPGSFRNC